MAPFEVVVIASSAGGLNALAAILADLAAGFPLPILLAQHRSATPADAFIRALRRSTSLLVEEAVEGDALRAGTVYVAPGGRHMSVQAGGSFASSPRLKGSCPSADLLFESVAMVYADRTIATVLTGAGIDGALGITSIRDRGGFVIAQDPRSSLQPGMPRAAVATRKVDLVLPLSQIAFALTALTNRASLN